MLRGRILRLLLWMHSLRIGVSLIRTRCMPSQPFCLLDRVLHRVASLHTCRIFLVAPIWDTQPWYATLLQLLVDFPRLLPTFDCLLLSPSGRPHPLVLSRHLRLAAWPMSSSASMQQDFLHWSCDSSPPLGGHQPMPFPGESASPSPHCANY